MLLLLAAGLLPVRGAAQSESEPPSASATPTETARQRGVIERKPEVHYLLDEDGKLIPVPGFSWEDFAHYFELQQNQQAENTPPAWLLQQTEVTGRAVGDVAELTVRVTVNVQSKEWVRVPLKLDGAVLLDQSATGGEFRLEASGDEGLLAWLKAPAPGEVHLELKLLKKLAQASLNRTLSLSLPRSPHTTYSLQVPEANAIAELLAEQGTVESAANATGSLLTGRLNSGAWELSWRAPPSGNIAAGVQDVIGTVAVKIDSDGVSSTAHLRLRAGQPIASLEITLPLGASLVQESHPGYGLEYVPAAEEGARPLARVQLYEPNTVADVRLQCRQDWISAERSIDLGGFAVRDALRQHGHVALRVAEELRADWEERFLVRQVEELPNELLGEGLLAGFEYSGQPFSLIARVSPRFTRVAIEPQYLVQINEREMRLSARLRCRVRGGKLHQLRVQMADWLVDEFGWPNDSVIASDDVALSDGSMLIPLERAMDGEFEVRFQATRPAPVDGGQVSFQLPRPEGSLIAPAQLVVLPGDNVRLAPKADAEMQLLTQRPDVTFSLPASRQAPLFYRGDVTNANYAAGYRIQASTLTASPSASVTVSAGQLQVVERIRYTSLNGSVERLGFRLPQGLEIHARLVDDADTPMMFAARSAGLASTAELFLPAPRFGPFEIEIDYSVPLLESHTRVELPIVLPVADRVGDCELRLPVSRDAVWQVNDSAWKRAARRDRSWESWTVLGTPAAVRLQRKPVSDAALVVVDRAWTQTYLVNDLRAERLVWRVAAPQGTVELRLPEGVLTRDVAVTVDGRPVGPVFQPSGAMSVTWPPEFDRAAVHVLEVDYEAEGVSGLLGSRLNPVQLVTPGAITRTEWEVLLPEAVHLLDASPEYFRAFSWRWENGYFARENARSSSELEHWVGGQSRDANSAALNRYLFAALGDPRPLELRTATRSSLVLLASSGVLLLGLVFLLSEGARRAEVVLAIAMAAIVGLAVAGDSAILLLQCAAPGVLPLSLAIFLERFKRRRRPAPSFLQGSTHPAMRRPVLERQRGSSISVPASSARVPQALAGDAP